jgi:hypothetical protein
MGLRQVLLQETIRAIALGYVGLVFLGLGRHSLGLSGNQVMALSGLATLAIFLSFTAVRLRTGRELMARTRREWAIVGMVAAIVVVVSIGVAATVGQLPRVHRFGPLSIVAAVLVIILFTWLGYRSTRGRR